MHDSGAAAATAISEPYHSRMALTIGTYLISYSDTDAGGVLHHAKYIEFAERGRHAWLRQRDSSFRKLGEDHCLTLVVCDIAAKYRAAIFLEDEIQVVTKLSRIDRRGLAWTTHITKDRNLAFSMQTKMVCLNSATKSIVSVPDFLILKFETEIDVASL